jgi:hypothetical protein
MRSFSIRCLAGVLALLLPAGVAFLARYLDRSKFRSDATYKALFPVVVCGSLLLAVLIPAVLVMTARIPLIYRVVITLAAWLLLAVELYWLFFTVVVAR